LNSGDWIELYNRSNDYVNIGNWYFSDGEADGSGETMELFDAGIDNSKAGNLEIYFFQ
jgi:hypothetical protein